MERTGKVGWGNLWVGILISIAILLILYSSFSGGGVSVFESKKSLIGYMQSVNGLVKGAPVRLSGVEVGNVKEIEFVNETYERRIRIRVEVAESVWPLITVDSKMHLGTIGMLGDKYVEIVPGTKGNPVAEDGQEIEVTSEVGLDAMIQETPETMVEAQAFVSDLREIGRRVKEGEGTAGKLINDTELYSELVAALDKTTHVLEGLQENQGRILSRLDNTLASTESMTAKVDRGEGSLGRMVNEEDLYDNMVRSTAHLDSILAKIDRGDGSAGALVNDQQLYEEIRNLVVRVNNLVADIEENPGRYFKFTIF